MLHQVMHLVLYPWAPGSQSRRPGDPRVPVSGRRSTSGAELRPQACSRDAIATAGVFSRLRQRRYQRGNLTSLTHYYTKGWASLAEVLFPWGHSPASDQGRGCSSH